MEGFSAVRLAALLDSIRGAKVVVAGDVMLDRHVRGAVDRVSPEAPIPVLHVATETPSPGGAANVAEKAAALGADARLVGAVGPDEAGRELASLVGARGVDPSGLLVVEGRPTTEKTRFIGRSQQMLRVDRETRGLLDADDADRLVEAVAGALEGAGALILEDYAKGVLSGETARRLIDAARSAGAAVIVDPAVTPYERYAGADIITPNESEARRAFGAGGDEAPLREVATRLSELAGGAVIAVTRGADGIALFRGAEGELHRPARRVEVFDVTGAGDAVAAAFGTALAAGVALEEAADLANLAGGAVVGQLGPGRIGPAELLAVLSGSAGASGKVIDRSSAGDWARTAREHGAKLAFTNGCLDILHAGHVKLLEGAASHGDKLIVGLNTDSSVRKLKGEGRPVLGVEERSQMLGALRAVDAVVVFDQETPLELIVDIRPDVLVKGADYSEDQVVGADIVKSYGGRVALVELLEGISTTTLIEKLREGNGGDGGE